MLIVRLDQEYWNVWSRMSLLSPFYGDDADDRLAVEVIKDFIALDPETQPRNVTAWTPVVTDVLRGSIEFEEDQVRNGPPCIHLPHLSSIVKEQGRIQTDV